MNITLTRTDGEVIFKEWPNQQVFEVATSILYIGTEQTGMPWLIYNDNKFVWQELDIDGNPTGNEFFGFKIGVMK
jgi:hypothetical protein